VNKPAAAAGRSAGALLASPAQQHAWLLERGVAGAPSPQAVWCCARLDGALEPARLAQALRATIARHPVLRSVFTPREGRLACDLRAPEEPLVAVEELPAGGDAEHRDAYASARAQVLAAAPFELERGPLLRAALLAGGTRRAYVVLVAHRIVCDAWSAALLLREALAAYAERPAPPPALDAWEHGERARRLLDDARGARELAYWRERLARAPAPPPLASGDGPPQLARRALDPALADALATGARALDPAAGDAPTTGARALAVTRFAACAAALQLALAQLGPDARTRLALPVADRAGLAVERVVGCLLNTVVLCGAPDPAAPFAEVARETQAALGGALAHARVPFAALAERLGLALDEQAAPPYQAWLELREPPRAFACADLAVRILDLPSPPAASAGREPLLTVALDCARPELRMSWRGEPAVSPTALLERWHDVLEAGLRQASGARHAPAAARARPAATTVDLVRASAETAPERTALLADDAELSFAALLERVDAGAARLRDAGVGPGVAVGLAAGRCAAAVVATLAIQAAGGACVPLDTAYPAERLRRIVADAGVALVLADDDVAGVERVGRLALDARGEAGVAAPATDVGAGTAWVFCTSGSTGRPKAVGVRHATIVARLRDEPFAWEPGDRGLHKSSPSYGDAIWELCAPLAHGCACVIADAEQGRDPRLLARLIERGGVTRVLFVPSLLAALLSLPEPDARRLAGLRSCIATGEVLTGVLAQRFHELLPDTTLFNVYGTTECWEVGWHVVPRTVRAGDTIPLSSRLLDGVQAWVVDEELRPLPADEPGELLVGGPGVADGYLGRPELTAERFVPLAPLGGDGIGYRTGDVVARDEHGALRLLGRRDNQVKLHGLRIELEEVERWLVAAPGVAAAAVAPRKDAAGSLVGLTACLVAAPDAEIDVAQVRRALAEQLPDHAIPTGWMRLARLPAAANGKLDRAALELLVAADAVALDGRGRDAPDVAPHDDVEQLLADIWRELLGVERVGVTDDFFALGGSSLLAVQLVMRVERALGVEVPLRELYARPTIAALREVVRT